MGPDVHLAGGTLAFVSLLLHLSDHSFLEILYEHGWW